MPAKSERFREGIVGLVVAGTLRPDQATSESTLLNLLPGIGSRTPLRTALAILSHEGIVAQTPQLGVSVKRVTPELLKEHTTLAHIVEQGAIALLLEDERYGDRLSDARKQVVKQWPPRRLPPANSRSFQDELIQAETQVHETIAVAGLGAEAGRRVALQGLRRRLFHAEHPFPLEGEVYESLGRATTDFVDQMLLSTDPNSVSSALDVCYAVQLDLAHAT